MKQSKLVIKTNEQSFNFKRKKTNTNYKKNHIKIYNTKFVDDVKQFKIHNKNREIVATFVTSKFTRNATNLTNY